MSFLLDTDICSAQLKNVRMVSNRFIQYGGRLYASAVTIAELQAWLLCRRTQRRYKKGYARLRQDLVVLDVDEGIALRAGEIAAGLSDRGIASKTPDMLLAATALLHAPTLVTHNTRDFANVPGLTVVDWLVP
jgi:tRNA(fMet)-specific endonuclease VapC